MTLRQFREVFTTVLIYGLILLPAQVHTLQKFKATVLELEQSYQLLLKNIWVHPGVPCKNEKVDSLDLLDRYLVQSLDAFKVCDGGRPMWFFFDSLVKIFVNIIPVTWSKDLKSLQETYKVLEIVITVPAYYHR